MKRWATVKKIIFLLICLMMAFSVALYSLVSISRFNLNIKDIVGNDWNKLAGSDLERFKVIDYIRKMTPEDSLFLVFRQNEFTYYAQRKVIRHLDPRLVEIYKLEDKNKAYNALLELGIDYIYTPNYMLPTYFNTQVHRIAADPRLCELVKETAGYRLFQLYKEPRSIKLDPVNIKNANFSSLTYGGITPSDWALYSRKNWNYLIDEDGQPALYVRSTDRKSQVLLYSGQGPLYLPPSNCFYKASIEPGTVYHFKTTVRGEGEFYVYLVEYSQDGNYAWNPLWKSVLSDRYSIVENQFLTSRDACEYRIAFATKWKGELFLRDFSMERVVPLNKVNVKKEEREKSSFNSKEKRWDCLQISDFEDVKPNSPQSTDWSLWPKSRIALSPESHSGKYAVRLTQTGWLCEGYNEPGLYLLLRSWLKEYLHHNQTSLSAKAIPGKILSRFMGDPRETEDSQSLSHRLSVFVKGKGLIGLFVWYEQENKKECLYLGRHYLPSDYERLNKIFKLPQTAKRIRVAFKLIDSYKEFQALYIDDLVLERENVKPFHTDKRNGLSN